MKHQNLLLSLDTFLAALLLKGIEWFPWTRPGGPQRTKTGETTIMKTTNNVSKHCRASLLAAFLIHTVILTSVEAQTTYSDGGTHNIDTESGPISLSNQTTLNVLTSGTVVAFTGGGNPDTGEGIEASSTSVVNINGGTVLAANGSDNSETCVGIEVSSFSVANINTGKVEAANGGGESDDCIGIEAFSNSVANINGGSIDTFAGGGNSQITLGIEAFSNSTVNINGGTFDTALGGGSSDTTEGIEALSNSTVNVYGTGFNYPLGPINDLSGDITGTLANGNSVNLTFTQQNAGEIVLQAAVPEPSTWAMTAAGVGGLLMFRKRRRL